MKVNVTMELEVEMDGLEYETEKGYENAMELFEEALEKAIKNNIERSWGFSDWPVKEIHRIYVFASSEEELKKLEEGACDECGKWQELDQGLCPACVEAIN